MALAQKLTHRLRTRPPEGRRSCAGTVLLRYDSPLAEFALSIRTMTSLIDATSMARGFGGSSQGIWVWGGAVVRGNAAARGAALIAQLAPYCSPPVHALGAEAPPSRPANEVYEQSTAVAVQIPYNYRRIDVSTIMCLVGWGRKWGRRS